MSIDGVWWNRTGLENDDPKRPGRQPRHQRTYETAVGDAKIQPYKLTGRSMRPVPARKIRPLAGLSLLIRLIPAPAGKPPNLPSLTAWSGQWHEVTDDAGQVVEFITTTWILTRQSDPADEWDSTMVNKDFFFRTKPTADELAKATVYGRAARSIK